MLLLFLGTGIISFPERYLVVKLIFSLKKKIQKIAVIKGTNVYKVLVFKTVVLSKALNIPIKYKE